MIEYRRRNWPRLSNYFQYFKDIRWIMCTTNIIEGFHRRFRTVIICRGGFQSEEALMKLMVPVLDHVTARCKKRVFTWNRTLAQLMFIREDKLQMNL